MKLRFPRSRSISFAVTTLLVTTLLATTSALPAHAIGAPALAKGMIPIWRVVDDFETDPAARWTGEGSQACGNCLYFDHDDPSGSHGGAGSAEIEAFHKNSWFGIRRTIFLPKANTSCFARVYVRLFTGKVNLEVIDPETWTYIALTTVTAPTVVTQPLSYQPVIAAGWRRGPGNVVIRISMVRDGESYSFSDVDDLTVQCLYQ